MKTNRIVQIAVIGLALLVILACGLTDRAVQQVKKAVPSAVPSEAVQFQAEDIRKATEATGVSLESGLEKLSGYRMSLHLEADGKEDDQQNAKHQLDILTERVQSRMLAHTKIVTDQSEDQVFEAFTVDRQTFIYKPQDKNNPCFLFTTGDNGTFELGRTSLDQIFSDLEQDKLIQSGEVVNGVKTDHYSVKNMQLMIGALDSYKAEIWLAQDGGYPVRFVGEADGKAKITAKEISGKLRWEYNLKDIDQVVDIPLPKECEQARQANSDIPVPADVNQKDIYGGVITFSSKDTPTVIADFYRSQLQAKGWKIDDESATDPLYIFHISKESRRMQVMVNPGTNGGSMVIISEFNP
jgi:hypothetical protein